ncbi:MAG: hypothetical protein RIQ81_701 [Pseudomonadota bacterium]|jgi:1-acyl-sn-glycerol-3-phosphate acyltransferase
MSVMRLLTQKRFGPFFLTQCSGAFNDNVFKNAMVIMLTYKSASESEGGLMVNAAAGLFILPFFLFSPIAGRIADKFDKGRIMRVVKVSEIAIMMLGSAGFFLSSIPILFTSLFLMGVHSTFFGPVKYSILPQHLRDDELMAGNALVEMGTFLSILTGTLLGGTLAAKLADSAGHNHGAAITAAWVMGIAIAGWLFSLFVPKAPAADPDLPLRFDFIRDTRELIQICKQREGIWNAVMGISWFWYFGGTFLAQLPSFAKHTLGSNDPALTTVMLATFSVSVGIGSLLSERLSRGDIELGMIPLGALGMSIFAADLWLLDPASAAKAKIAWEFVGLNGVDVPWRVLFDIGMCGISGSLFIVPLYAYIQHRSEARTRSRLIAANNLFNAVFMVASALFTIMFYKLGLNTAEILLVSAIMNLLVSGWIIALIPEFLMRFVVWILASTIYRIHYKGRDLIPSSGAALVVANHVSFIDWFILAAACRRPVRFVMDHHFFMVPGIKIFAEAAKAIPIAPAKEDAALKEKSFELISAALREGHIVCIFPEGGITRDGKLLPFRPGVDRILRTDPVPVYTISLNGLWGSFFSRKGGRAMSRLPRPSWRVIDVEIRKFEGKAGQSGESSWAGALQKQISEMVEPV